MPKQSKVTDLRVAFLVPSNRAPHPETPQPAPRLVIALRGTLLYLPKDFRDNFRISQERLAESDRVEECQALIVKVIDYFLTEYGGSVDDICLAGHSLGAGIVLLVGKHLAASGKAIDTHLFAPPLLSINSILEGEFLPEMSKPETLAWKHSSAGTRKMMSVSHVGEVAQDSGVGDAADAFEEMKGNEVFNKEWEDFQNLQDWVPHFYLSREDMICLRYIKYYEDQMQARVTRANVPICKQGIWTRLCWGDAKYIRNVVPSANLYISTKYTDKVWNLKVHSLQQWHRFTDDNIWLEEFQARRLDLPKES